MEAAASNMLELEEDSSVFMQWAMDTLLQEEPEPEPVHAVQVDVDVDIDDCFGDGNGDGGEAVVFPSLQALRDASHATEMVRELMDAASSWTTSSSGSGGSWPAPPPPQSGNTDTNTNTSSLPAVSWNFITGSAQPGSDAVLEEASAAVPIPARSCLPPENLPQRRRSSPPPQPARRAHHLRSTGGAPPSSASCTPDHIVAERNRREKINKRLIELSTVIPGLKKMDKATILSDAAKYVKELQQRLKALEQASATGGSSIRSKVSPAPTDENNNGGSGSPTSASSSSGPPAAALPEIDARFSERSAMVRIHCGGGKGVAAAALAVVEGLGLTVVHANVMPFSACTIIITITAEMEGRLTLTTDQIVAKLKSALSQQRSSCKDTEEIEN